jgi:hypothetical protein
MEPVPNHWSTRTGSMLVLAATLGFVLLVGGAITLAFLGKGRGVTSTKPATMAKTAESNDPRPEGARLAEWLVGEWVQVDGAPGTVHHFEANGTCTVTPPGGPKATGTYRVHAPNTLAVTTDGTLTTYTIQIDEKDRDGVRLVPAPGGPPSELLFLRRTATKTKG